MAEAKLNYAIPQNYFINVAKESTIHQLMKSVALQLEKKNNIITVNVLELTKKKCNLAYDTYDVQPVQAARDDIVKKCIAISGRTSR